MCIKRCVRLISMLAIWAGAAFGVSAQVVIDDFSYPTDSAAQAVWRPSPGGSEGVMSSSGAWGEERVLLLPISYTAEVERRYWDGEIARDLSEPAMMTLEVYVDDPGPIAYFTLYFHSPGGWTGKSVEVHRAGWQRWTFSKKDFINEGAFFDWALVDRIRLSPWKAIEGECFLALRELYAYSPDIALVEGDLNYAGVIEKTLSEWWLPYGYITDASVASRGLGDAQVAIFPYNPAMSTTEIEKIEQFARAGGKIFAFYALPGRLADVLGLRMIRYLPQEYPGQFSAFRFQAPEIPALPERVMQSSGNIHVVEPSAPDARVIAYWEDSEGIQQPYPAWLASSTGVYMSHVLLNDDAETKIRMLLALLGHLRPATWEEAARAALNYLGQVGDHYTYESATGWIRDQMPQSPRSASVEMYLNQSESLRQQGLESLAQEDYRQGVLTFLEAHEALLEAYYYAPSPQGNEFRAWWEHSGLGAYPGNWVKSMANLRHHGFNTIIPNMMSAGVAHFNSALLPHSEDYETYGDQIAQCVEAARLYDMEVHVWKVNWNLIWAPPEYIDALRAAQRTQVDVHGAPVNWLCPSHPDNLILERETMLEVVRNYDVAGIHFDYIRYPNGDCCYCDGCRQRFQEQTGHVVAVWPGDCYNGVLAAEYRQWRAQQITRLVQAVSTEAHDIKPDIEVSAAVFNNYPRCVESVGQDWLAWVEDGSLDFICPMDYTSDFERFRSLVSTQLERVAGRIPLYPGIGATAGASALSSDGVIAQILIARRQGATGFVVFNYSAAMAEQILPDLAKGITAPPSASVGGLWTY